jgi:hypothetical protein
MNIKELLQVVAYFIWKPMLQSLIIIGLLLFVERNLITILLTIISVNLSFKLFEGKPIIKEWFNAIFWAVVIVSFIYLVVYWLGAYGLIGSLLIVSALAGYRIYLGWSLFDKVTTWGAERLTGKHNDNFDIKDLKNKGDK